MKDIAINNSIIYSDFISVIMYSCVCAIWISNVRVMAVVSPELLSLSLRLQSCSLIHDLVTDLIVRFVVMMFSHHPNPHIIIQTLHPWHTLSWNCIQHKNISQQVPLNKQNLTRANKYLRVYTDARATISNPFVLVRSNTSTRKRTKHQFTVVSSHTTFSVDSITDDYNGFYLLLSHRATHVWCSQIKKRTKHGLRFIQHKAMMCWQEECHPKITNKISLKSTWIAVRNTFCFLSQYSTELLYHLETDWIVKDSTRHWIPVI